MMQELLRKKKLLIQNKSRTSFKYKLLFASIIPPHYTTSLNSFAFTSWADTVKLPNKYYVKQSYLILAWFYHLKTITCKVSKKVISSSSKQVIKFIILPSKKSHYTLLKAPMAHKKNSKEQFLFKFYFILASFKGLTEVGKLIPSCDAAVSLLFMIQRLFPVLSTNLLLSKSTNVKFSYSDYVFFSYYSFVSKNKKVIK